MSTWDAFVESRLRDGATTAADVPTPLVGCYDDVEREYRALCNGPALVDRSYRGLIEVTGADRAGWLQNLTTNEISYDVSLAPDGSFSGFVPVSVGANRVLVTALASDGGEASIELALDFEKSGLNGRELAIELERIKKRNKELMLLLERKRIQSFRDRQRKRVVIEADESAQ